MKADGRTAQSVIAEAIALLKDKREGKLAYIEFISDIDNISINLVTETDDDNIPVVAAPVDEVWYEDEELVVEDIWNEVDVENADEIEDYELLDSKNSQELEKNPVNLLIQAYRSATSLDEINEVLNLYGEFEQQAWFSLTLLERRRVVEIMS